LNEKLFIQDNFREPMHLRVPFPAWAMNPREVGRTNATINTVDDDLAEIIDQ
jgi:hypothetical protein